MWTKKIRYREREMLKYMEMSTAPLQRTRPHTMPWHSQTHGWIIVSKPHFSANVSWTKHGVSRLRVSANHIVHVARTTHDNGTPASNKDHATTINMRISNYGARWVWFASSNPHSRREENVSSKSSPVIADLKEWYDTCRIKKTRVWTSKNPAYLANEILKVLNRWERSNFGRRRRNRKIETVLL